MPYRRSPSTGGSGASVSGAETVTTVAASGASQTLTLDSSGLGTWDLTLTANCTLTFAGATAGKACTITLLLRQDATGARTVTWPGSVNWTPSGGTAPTLSSAAGAVDVITFVSDDGGTTWLGFAGQKNAVGWQGRSTGWFRPSNSGGSINVTSVQGQLLATPFDLGSVTLTQIAVNVTTAVASTSVRVGIYADNNGVPGSLLLEPTSVTALDSTTTGNKTTGSFSQAVSGRFWVGVCAQGGTPALSGVGGQPTIGVGYDTAANAFSFMPTGYTHNGTVSGTLPTLFVVNNATTNVLMPVVRVG